MIALQDYPLLGSIEASSEGELKWVCGILEQEHFIEFERGMRRSHAVVTQRGYIRAEELRSSPILSDQGFVAMSFDPSLDETFTNGFFVGIDRAGWTPF